MSETTATSGANGSTSGEPNKKVTSTSGDETYPKEFVEKLKKEKENLSKTLSGLQEQLTALQKEKQTKEETDLQSQNKFKELYEAQKAKSESIEKELLSTKETIIEGKKNTALRAELVKLGLDEVHLEPAFKLLDKKNVQFDPNTGVVIGADDAAKTFHQAYSSLGFFKKQATGANHTASVGQPGKTDISKMSIDDKLKLLATLKK
jgi:hypothetical protein